MGIELFLAVPLTLQRRTTFSIVFTGLMNINDLPLETLVGRRRSRIAPPRSGVEHLPRLNEMACELSSALSGFAQAAHVVPRHYISWLLFALERMCSYLFQGFL